MKELPVIHKTLGLDISRDSSSFSMQDGGYSYLAKAVNVEITDGQQIVRRNGYEEIGILSGLHSLKEHRGVLYGSSGDNIYAVLKDGTTTLIRSGIQGKIAWVSYSDKLFYSNGTTTGFIHNFTDYAWQPSDYVGPTSSKDRSKPPAGTVLETHLSRIFIGSEKTVWYTNALELFTVNMANNFMSYDCNVVAIVSNGVQLVVCTELDIFIYSGTEVKNFEQKKLKCGKVIAGTELVANNPTVLGKQIQGDVIIFTTNTGVYAIPTTGEIVDLVDGRLTLPNATYGSAYMFDGMYTALINT